VLGALVGCTGVAPGITPVDNFDVNRYLGTWYEIARLDHPFERGLEQVTAQYALREDGGLRVVNRGVSSETGEPEVAQGRAYFVGDPTTGHLKVSFLGPFYGSYVIFELDAVGYDYAFVTSYDKNYLWFLSRRPTVDEALRDHFVDAARSHGFDTTKLIYVKQNAPESPQTDAP
jgi:apolipoprotein D and lipocalin family protein